MTISEPNPNVRPTGEEAAEFVAPEEDATHDDVAPARDTATGTEPRRFGDGDQFEALAETTYSGGVAIFVRGPQADSGADELKLWETWEDGASGFLVNRQAIARAQAVASTDKVDVYPTDVSAATPTTVGDGAQVVRISRNDVKTERGGS